MSDVKYCKSCGVKISDINQDDWYRHMSVKYCSECRKESDRRKTALRVNNLRQRKKEKDKFRDEQLKLYAEENELLRQRVIQLREEVMRSVSR